VPESSRGIPVRPRSVLATHGDEFLTIGRVRRCGHESIAQPSSSPYMRVRITPGDRASFDGFSSSNKHSKRPPTLRRSWWVVPTSSSTTGSEALRWCCGDA